MANSFSNNLKVKMVAAAAADNMDYVKASRSYMSQAELQGKKFGREYKVYIPDPGKVVNGLVADPDAVDEVEVPIMLDNNNNSCELTAWNTLTDVEDFKEEIAKPRGVALARKTQADIVKANVFKSAQAVVASAPGFGVLSDAAAALNELAVAGEVVSFMKPEVMGKIAASGLANFIAAQEAKEIYGKNALGTYAGATQIELAVLPVLSTPADMSATISLTQVTDADSNVIGFDPITKITAGAGVTLKPGFAYKAEGLKVVDGSGLQTEQDYAIITIGADGSIPELRITIDGASYNNPNAWVAAGTTTLTLTPLLTASKTYWVGQVRCADSLAFDDYKFLDLPGSDNSEVAASVGGVTVKMSEYGNGTTLTKLVRLDLPYAAGIVDHRGSITTYIEKA
jgi:hypothetical protein